MPGRRKNQQQASDEPVIGRARPSGNRGRGQGAGRGRGRGAAAAHPPPAAPAVVPPPAPTAAVESLASDLEEKERVTVDAPPQLVQPLVRTHFPPRPGFGRAGRAVKVFANHFKVNFKLAGDVFHYDVSMAEAGRSFGNDGPPKALAGKIMAALMAELKRQFPDVALVSDARKNIYAPRRLPFQQQSFGSLALPDDGGRAREFSAVVKEADPVAIRMQQLEELFAGRLNYTPYDALQALDVALRHSASQRFTVVGRNLFSNAGAKTLGEGAELWFGYYQSLRPTQNRLVVNLDLAATAFVEAMDVTDFLCETLALRQMPASLAKYQHSAFSKAVRGVKVNITHRPGVKRSYRVNGLSRDSADNTFFENDEGQRMSIAQYFQKTYNIRLRYPKLPCLHVGAPQKKNYLPMEVCHIMAGQKCPRKVTDKQVANMIKFTCTPPDQRKRAIEQKFREAGFNTDPTLRAFGLEVDPNMVETTGRQLPPPAIEYSGGARESPRDGAWNMRGKKFNAPAQFKSWAVISMCDPNRCSLGSIQAFFKAVMGQMGQLGMRCPKTPPPILLKKNRQDSVRGMFQAAVTAATQTFKVKPDIVWMINPVSDARAYGDLKVMSDTENGVGIVSQCMLSKHIPKCNPQYIANILMKVNTKLGGRNGIISGPLPQVSASRTIIFGADVTHPSPMDKTRPSIAAVTASMDANFIRHASAIRAQGHRVEQIENLKDMTIELMKQFYQSTRGKPDRIVFYRDGVSEGQFHMVLNYEVTAIREACQALEKGYMPPITFVIVQKRHNTRLFPSNRNEADRSGNVKAGTVVESGICHPIENDFYLMSHAGLQGTSRPTHYHVLLDEIGFTADELQTLTYKLCYTFARCTRSVSMVPSAYYSHLVAFRARFFLVDGSDTASTVSGFSDTAPETDTRMYDVHPLMKGAMYFV
ncbi:Protein argonaute-2 [Phytophthora rubi]|uniref:Protein argonaute-2 n=1 Tax=Phytophthora rubi TaxID=129364 RepID=A0A6A4EYF2_9STRA|nr:Protein argonaute-2 [Phytophthora rubi]KAE9330056.1 Protein argonaute-2 [Phytophthora rubi]